MVLAHREELINQAAEKIKSITGADVGIEMGALVADGESLLGPEPSVVVSDRGAEAERAFLAADDWENPFWLRLFEAERKAIERDSRGKHASKIPIQLVRLLLKDSRLALARDELKVSYPVFRTNIENLKMRFALVFRALQAYRAFRTTFTF